MADIFEEVEEGLRQDQMTGLWKRYGIFAYLAAALLIGGVALFEYSQHRRAQDTEMHATTLETGLEALAAGEYEAAAETFTALKDQNVAVSPVAAHFLANVRLEGNGDDALASAVLLEAANMADDIAANPTASLALLKSAYLVADTASQAELEGLLAPLLGSGTAFDALAQELIAAKILQSGDFVAARRAFTDLRFSDKVPAGVITRANQALAALPPVVQAQTDLVDGAPEDNTMPDPAPTPKSDPESEE